jgi:hypothetical protein
LKKLYGFSASALLSELKKRARANLYLNYFRLWLMTFSVEKHPYYK